jgi:hypothetical protein
MSAKPLLPILAALALAACASAPPEQPVDLSPPPKPVAVLQICLPLTSWSNAQQDQMGHEYDALGAKAILRAVFRDWLAMRKEDKACIAAQTPK